MWWLTLQVQQGERKLTAQIKTLERHLEMERQVQKNLQTYASEIEETLKTSTEESQKQVSGVPAATVFMMLLWLNQTDFDPVCRYGNSELTYNIPNVRSTIPSIL